MSNDYVIGVGNSDAAASMHDADLQGNLKAYAPARLVSNGDDKGQLVFTTTFGLNEANFEWNETALFVNGRLIKRKVIIMGWKPPDSSWVVTYKLDANNPSIDLDIRTGAIESPKGHYEHL